MWFVVLLFIVCVVGGWAFFRAIGNILFPKSKPDNYPHYPDDNTKIYNKYYHTENHLHITDEQLNKLIKKDGQTTDTSQNHRPYQ